MREAGVPIAVATDYNPGSAMCSDLQLAAGLAITQCGLHAEEALLGITRYAAAALALKDRGIIENGRKADCIILETPSPYSLVYHWAYNPIHQVIKNGVLV
jgi:imidazolonepropionase